MLSDEKCVIQQYLSFEKTYLQFYFLSPNYDVASDVYRLFSRKRACPKKSPLIDHKRDLIDEDFEFIYSIII